MLMKLNTAQRFLDSWRLGVNPTKLFFFPNEEFLRFLLVSLRFGHPKKKIIDSKMT